MKIVACMGDYEVTIKRKFLKGEERKNAEVDLPSHFKLIVVSNDISIKIDGN